MPDPPAHCCQARLLPHTRTHTEMYHAPHATPHSTKIVRQALPPPPLLPLLHAHTCRRARAAINYAAIAAGAASALQGAAPHAANEPLTTYRPGQAASPANLAGRRAPFNAPTGTKELQRNASTGGREGGELAAAPSLRCACSEQAKLLLGQLLPPGWLCLEGGALLAKHLRTKKRGKERFRPSSASYSGRQRALLPRYAREPPM